MKRNPFFHAPAADEPATISNGLADLLALLAMIQFVVYAILLLAWWVA